MQYTIENRPKVPNEFLKGEKKVQEFFPKPKISREIQFDLLVIDRPILLPPPKATPAEIERQQILEDVAREVRRLQSLRRLYSEAEGVVIDKVMGEVDHGLACGCHQCKQSGYGYFEWYFGRDFLDSLNTGPTDGN